VRLVQQRETGVHDRRIERQSTACGEAFLNRSDR
jgi:hypothetical protein